MKLSELRAGCYYTNGKATRLILWGPLPDGDGSVTQGSWLRYMITHARFSDNPTGFVGYEDTVTARQFLKWAKEIEPYDIDEE